MLGALGCWWWGGCRGPRGDPSWGFPVTAPSLLHGWETEATAPVVSAGPSPAGNRHQA